MSRSISLCINLLLTSSLLALLILFQFSSVLYAQENASLSQGGELQFPGAAPCDQDLQACIDAAPDGSTIHIAPGSYSGSFTLSRTVSLVGSGIDATTLSGAGDQRVLHIYGSAVNNQVRITDLTIQGGKAVGSDNPNQNGGGILIEEGATPQLARLLVRDNYSLNMGGGIAIINTGAVTLSEVQLIGNRSEGTGGGLCSNAQSTTIENSLLQDNQAQHGGGALIKGYFALTNVTVSRNQAAEMGGGIYGGMDAKFNALISQISHSSFTHNQAGYQGGGAFLFNANIDHSQFTGNQAQNSTSPSAGGALASSNSLTVTKSTFLGNSASDGGAIAELGGKLWVNNTLFSDNSGADANSGAALSLVDASPVTRACLTHVTIAGHSQDETQNNAAAIKSGMGEVRLTNSIVVHHATAILNGSGRIIEQTNLYYGNGQNLVGEIMRSLQGVDADPLFEDAAALNFHLLPDSPAINKGSAVADVVDDIDEQVRPEGGAPDIGYDEAVEKAFAPEPVDPSPTFTNVYLPLVVK